VTADILYRHNSAKGPEIRSHLLSCDADFIPRLSERVVITEYSEKLVRHAERFEAWSSGKLIGLLAAYANDPNNELGYISNVSVASAWHGRGIAGNLVERCISFLANKGYDKIKLEVGTTNTPALKLYKKWGFKMASNTEHTVPMWLLLK
jgi:ribosomal protein S18 acetylase RimI-like enzyme